MKKFLLSDLFFGLIITLAVAVSYLSGNAMLKTVELKFFDLRSRLCQNTNPPDEIAIVAIDDDSLAKLGRWPWPRSRIAEMIKLLDSYGPKAIGLNIIFSEPDTNPALAEFDRLKEEYRGLIKSRAIQEKGSKGLSAGATSPFLLDLETARQNLDEDAKFVAGIAGRKVVLPMYFQLGSGLGGKTEPLPPEAGRSSMTLTGLPPEENMLEGEKATYPILALSSAAAGIGQVNVITDVDGTVRDVPLAVPYGGFYYPYYALELLRVYMGLDNSDLMIAPGKKIQLGKIEAPIDENSLFLVTWRGPAKTFRYYSFFDVLNGKVNADQFKGRIVLLGLTAQGVGQNYVTPVSANFPSMEIVANVIENLLNKKFLSSPGWGILAELGAIILTGLFVMFLLPRLKAGPGAALSFLLLGGIIGSGIWLFVYQSEWVKMSYPAVLLALGYIVVMTKRFLMTEKRKELVEASQIETSKMLGLSFQGQGMLDLAFDKFRACPLDSPLAELLYNLGLDFERKRQYNKAVSVYEHIACAFPKYRDIPSKLDTLRKASEGAVFGGAIGRPKDATIMTEGAGMKPTLGRYEVEKELGRGAMGIVYLGRDPKINRQVAIKTMMFEAEGSEEAMKELKMRFFREAESAGNLNHPNIVRIFDAGEDNEVCYIAMELLHGKDLKERTRKDNLLPLADVLDYMAKAADALDYAHQQGIVHRDVKPANIMLLEDGTLRLTDFGIARITASSKTATGTMMGTPSYMSPEQVAGKKVDGRADIWSLGVTLFELCTGEKPFKGGEAIGTLLFQIANDPLPDPVSLRPDMPADLAAIITRALKKNPDERYQRAAEMAADLRKARARITGGQEPPPPPAAEPAPAAPAARTDLNDRTMKAGDLNKPNPA